jgi:LPXTG-site transpeptidase (sortase) family protein
VPGEIGSAVLAGHVDNGLALPGVFKHLADVKNNDEIYITIGNTEKLRFKVISTAVYNYKDVPVQDIFGRDDDRYLTLVTCTGSLIRSEHTYDERLVVRAIRE